MQGKNQPCGWIVARTLRRKCVPGLSSRILRIREALGCSAVEQASDRWFSCSSGL
jgi:hypothetical protein